MFPSPSFILYHVYAEDSIFGAKKLEKFSKTPGRFLFWYLHEKKGLGLKLAREKKCAALAYRLRRGLQIARMGPSSGAQRGQNWGPKMGPSGAGRTGPMMGPDS